jgi:hypothetical protein
MHESSWQANTERMALKHGQPSARGIRLIARLIATAALVLGVTSAPQRLRASPAGDVLHATIALSSARMGNGLDSVAAIVRLSDERGFPLPGKSVALRASTGFVATGNRSITDASGAARFSVRMSQPYPHYATASGPVVLSAIDVTDDLPLTATALLTVYNRVVLLMQGAGTSLRCTISECHDRTFSQISHDILAPIGYNLNGDGRHRTELEFGYHGGSMARDTANVWQWLIQPYQSCDTTQSLADSDAALRSMMRAYMARYPYTTFEILAHSLGGVVALDTLAGDGGAFLRSLGPAAVDKIITVDSPLNGLDRGYGSVVVAGVVGALVGLHDCRSQLFGAELIGALVRLGQDQPLRQEHWIETLRRLGVEVMTITNTDDRLIPQQYAVIDERAARHQQDRMRFAVGSSHENGHGALLYRELAPGIANPAWPVLVSTLQEYLTTPCMVFATDTRPCEYPSVNWGF